MLWFSSVVMIAVSIGVIACQERQPIKTTDAEAPAQMAVAAAARVQQEKQEFIVRIQNDVDQVRADIEDLLGRTKTASAKNRIRLERDIRALREKWRLADHRLSEAKVASVDAWKEMKSGIEKMVRELKQSSARMKKEYRQA